GLGQRIQNYAQVHILGLEADGPYSLEQAAAHRRFNEFALDDPSTDPQSGLEVVDGGLATEGSAPAFDLAILRGLVLQRLHVDPEPTTVGQASDYSSPDLVEQCGRGASFRSQIHCDRRKPLNMAMPGECRGGAGCIALVQTRAHRDLRRSS